MILLHLTLIKKSSSLYDKKIQSLSAVEVSVGEEFIHAIFEQLKFAGNEVLLLS